jgi:hypothetical protein
MRDEGIRTEVQDAVSDVLDGYELLITPWPARQSSPPRTAAQKGPASVHGIDVDPLIGWFLTWPADFSGHPVASIPARARRQVQRVTGAVAPPGDLLRRGVPLQGAYVLGGRLSGLACARNLPIALPRDDIGGVGVVAVVHLQCRARVCS